MNNTWNELMIVNARFYSAGSQSHSGDLTGKNLWWFPADAKYSDVIQGVGTTPMMRFTQNAIHFSLTPIPYSPHPAGAKYVEQILKEVEWDDPYMDQLAGIVMAKRLADETSPLTELRRMRFQFLTLWSMTQAVHYDAEGLKSPYDIVELQGEFDLNTQHINTQHTAFMMLWYAQYQSPCPQEAVLSFTNTQELSRQLQLPSYATEFQGALYWLNDHRMVTLEKGSAWDYVTPTERGRAYLNGDILP